MWKCGSLRWVGVATCNVTLIRSVLSPISCNRFAKGRVGLTPRFLFFPRLLFCTFPTPLTLIPLTSSSSSIVPNLHHNRNVGVRIWGQQQQVHALSRYTPSCHPPHTCATLSHHTNNAFYNLLPTHSPPWHGDEAIRLLGHQGFPCVHVGHTLATVPLLPHKSRPCYLLPSHSRSCTTLPYHSPPCYHPVTQLTPLPCHSPPCQLAHPPDTPTHPCYLLLSHSSHCRTTHPPGMAIKPSACLAIRPFRVCISIALLLPFHSPPLVTPYMLATWASYPATVSSPCRTTHPPGMAIKPSACLAIRAFRMCMSITLLLPSHSPPFAVHPLLLLLGNPIC